MKLSANTRASWQTGSEFGSILGGIGCALIAIHTGTIFGLAGLHPLILGAIGLGGGAIMGAALVGTLFAAGSIITHNVPGMAALTGSPDLDKIPAHEPHQTHIENPSQIRIEDAIDQAQERRQPRHIRSQAERQAEAERHFREKEEHRRANNQTKKRGLQAEI